MNGTDPGNVVRRFLEALHRDGVSEEVIDGFTSDEHLKASILEFEVGFPGYRLIAKDTVAEGDSVALRFFSDLHHTGDFQRMPPTGVRYRIEGIAFCHVTDGRVTECRLVSDMLGLMRALNPTRNAVVEA